MKLSRWLILFAFLISTLLVFFYKNWKLHEQEIFTQHINHSETLLATTIQQYQMVADANFVQSVNIPPVLEIMAQVEGADSALKNRLRGRLYKQLYPTYKKLNTFDFKQFHFHLPNNTSFLRFHRLDHFGDTLTADRQSVKRTNESRSKTHGFELGKHFHAYRNVYPLNYQNQNVGTMEISLPFETILKKAQQLIEDHDFLFVMKKDYVFAKLYLSEQEIYKTLSINSDYVFEDFSHLGNEYHQPLSPTIKNLNKSLQPRIPEIQQKMALNQSFVLSHWHAKKNYLIEFIPIRNISNDQRAYIIFYFHSKELEQLRLNFIISIGLIIIFLCAVLFFILKQYQWEKILVRARQQAELANKSKSEFITNVSHEIRTPLNGVLGMASVLSKTPLNSKQTNLLNLLQRSGDSLLRVINDILDISQVQSGDFNLNPQSFNLFDLLDEIEAIFAEQFKQKKINFILQRPSNISEQFYYGDIERINQILFNLLDNALKFTEQGYVTLEVSAQVKKDNNMLLSFIVSDTGIGISKSYQEHIFQVFSQADGSITRKYGGTGLGLVISKKLAKLMQGNLEFESASGVGSKFIFQLPLPIAHKASTESFKPIIVESNISTTLSSPKVLLVEDNIVNQEVAIGTLEYLGCQVSTCPDGEKAVKEYKQKSFDLVLMDISMPIMDGIEATKQIRQYERHIGSESTAIIALTAHATDDFKNQCLAAGMNDMLTKPFSISIMDRKLKKWLPRQIKAPSLGQSNTSNKSPDLGKKMDSVLDPAAFAQLRELQKANTKPTIVEKVINHYLTELPKLLQAMDLAINENNSDKMWQAAHSLKSSSINIGAMQFSELCLEIESLGKQGQCSEALFKRLQQQAVTIKSALQQQLDIESRANRQT